MFRTIVTLVLLVALAATVSAQTTTTPDVWRTVAQRIDVGTRIKLHLHDGQRVNATLISANADDIAVQPRTRVPVGIQRVPYSAILLLERDEARGIGVGKAVALGVAAGASSFLGLLLLAIASWD